MFTTIIFASLLVRYYLKQREEFNAIALRLRDDVSGDALVAYNAAYTAGAKTRALYEEYYPPVVDTYKRVASEVASRFGR